MYLAYNNINLINYSVVELQLLYTQLNYTIHGVYVIICPPKRNDYLSQLTLAFKRICYSCSQKYNMYIYNY